MRPSDTVKIPYRCGRSGEEWLAHLGPLQEKFAFVGFERASAYIETIPKTLEDRMRDLLAPPSPADQGLMPPQSADLVNADRPGEISPDDIVAWGFKCPTCDNERPVLCPSCRKYFCDGTRKDSQQRWLCPWCSTQFAWVSRSASDAADHDADKQEKQRGIEIARPTLEVRYRELPPGQE